MKLRAKIVPYSGVVGQSIMLVDEDGRCVATLAVRIPSVKADYKETAQEVARQVARALNQ